MRQVTRRTRGPQDVKVSAPFLAHNDNFEHLARFDVLGWKLTRRSVATTEAECASLSLAAAVFDRAIASCRRRDVAEDGDPSEGAFVRRRHSRLDNASSLFCTPLDSDVGAEVGALRQGARQGGAPPKGAPPTLPHLVTSSPPASSTALPSWCRTSRGSSRRRS